MEGGDDLGAVAGVDVNAAAAERDEHVLDALFKEDLCGAVRALEIRDGDAGHFLCLDLVRGDKPAALQEFVGDGLIRGGIQDDADAVLLGKLCYGLVGILIDLELQQNIGGIADALLNGLDVLGRDGAAGARNNDDLILARILIDHDEGDARCDVVVIEEKILRHVQLGHDVQCHVRHGIAAQLRDHCHIAASLMRRDALIEALAAGALLEEAALDRLGGSGQMRGARHEIDDKAAKYRYLLFQFRYLQSNTPESSGSQT